MKEKIFDKDKGVHMESKAKIAFFGLGKMGMGPAMNLLKSGFPVYSAIHKNMSTAKNFEEAGGVIDVSAKAAIKDADYIISIVPDDRALYDLATKELLDEIKQGALWIEMTSCSSDAVKYLESELTNRNIYLLDAPVSGGTIAANAGTMTMMCAGNRKALELAQPVLDVIGEKIFHVSENVGDGKKIKMLNNLLSAMNKAAAGEIWRIAKNNNLDSEKVFQVITASSGDSKGFQQAWKRLEENTFEATFTVEHMKKDVDLAINLTDGLSCPLSDITKMYYDTTVNAFSGEDSSAVAKTEISFNV